MRALPSTAVLLPGSGSDEVFVTAVFADALAAVGVRLVAPAPRPGPGVVEAMTRDLDALVDRRRDGGVLVGGVSLGAHVAARWAARRPGRAAGLLVALPAWIGEPGGPREPGGPDTPRGPGTPPAAAVSARATADAVRRDGVDRVLAGVRESVPRWLADELDRAWRRHGDGLADSLDVAARTPAPTVDELRAVTIPAGVAAAADDPLHPLTVADAWATALPAAALVTTTLGAVGRDHGVLGRAAVLAWLRGSRRAA